MSNRKKRFIPFSWTPASWGLRGPAREEAEAAYYYEGIDLDHKIAEIRNRDDADALKVALAKVDRKHDKISDYDLETVRIDADPKFRNNSTGRARAHLAAQFDHGVITAHECDIEWAKLDYTKGDELALALLAIELRHGKITEYEYDTSAFLIEYPEDGTERELARLEIENRHGKMKDLAYQKARATLLEEPWVGIVDQGVDASQGLDGVYFEFDWNEFWITFLRLNGYYGRSDEEVVDQWFSDVCRSQGMNAQAPVENTVVPFSGRILNRMPDE